MSGIFSQCLDKNDKRFRLAQEIDRIYRSIKPWDRIKNPDGPTGTPYNRRIKRLVIALEKIEEHLPEYLE